MNKLINLQSIKELNPCSSGLNNFIKYYESFEGSLSDLLQLEEISYNDKIWVATKVCDIKILNQWSLDCATLVLDNYEKVYPNDSRIRDCLNITSKYLLGDATKEELLAARSAARSARSACSAAHSAAYSAAHSAADSAAYSAYSAAHSAADSAAYSACSAARSAARNEQENINISLLIALL